MPRISKSIIGLLGLLTFLAMVMFQDNDQFTHEESLGEPEFVIVLCRGSFGAKDYLRQLRQISVLLKSAAALTSRTLKFNIVSDSYTTYQVVTNITQSWPNAYRNRIIFPDYREVFYPPQAEEMKIQNMFRPCATGRLFLEQAYKEKDNLVYLDTDVLFLMPPEKLWWLMNSFNSQQVIGIAPTLYYYGPSFTAFPTYGTSGLNSGVLLMNLKRIRSFEGGWTSTILEIVKKYRTKLKLGDQDILNILFSNKTRATQLYELGCEWNYRERLCSSGTNKCKRAQDVGVGLLHGINFTFISGQEPKFQAVFEAWEQHQLDEPISVFMTRLNATLERQEPSRGCSRISFINQLLLRGLQDTLKKKG